MHTPLRRHDGLIVVQPYYAALLGLSHDMSNGLLLRKVEIIVSLNTASMSMGRHRVPGSSRIQLSQTKLQLAGTFLQHIIDNKFVNGTVVALLQ